MKKTLLTKTLRPQLFFASIVFALSIPSYFLLVDWIWLKELDENNALIAQRIENEFNEQHISDEKLAENITFWNEIQPVSQIEHAVQPLPNDLRYTIRRKNPYANKIVFDRFRGLKTNIKINSQDFILVVETNVEETEETVAYIAAATLVFFLILITGFWILNRQLSKKIWLPFQDTLQQLKSFQLNFQEKIDFKATDILEFSELNATLDKLLQHSIDVYRSRKEFTENASHELQTPLAVMKNKLDVLLQGSDLTERQYHIAEEMNKSLIRSSRINKNLLLLAKIENSQFDGSELVRFDVILEQSIASFNEFFREKNVIVNLAIHRNIELIGNAGLAEVLINNLLTNAIRHTLSGSLISVRLSKLSFEVRNVGNQILNVDLLFKRFSKMSSNNTGSGLGLSIIKEISKFHSWHVSYNFENGEHIFLVTF